MSTAGSHIKRGYIPDWQLERFALQELPQAEMQRLREQLAHDDDLRQRLQALQLDDEAIRRQYPVPWMARQIEARIQVRAAGWPQAATQPPVDTVVGTLAGSDASWWRWSPALAIGLVILAALTTLQPALDTPTPMLREQVRIKGGGPRLLLHRQTATGSQRLLDGARAGAGDLLRIEYDAAGAAYGAIVSVDGAGSVTRHFPVDGPLAATLESGVVALDFAYELDDAPAWERFYFITSDTAFAMASVLAAAAVDVPGATPPVRLPLASGLQQAGWSLAKSGQIR